MIDWAELEDKAERIFNGLQPLLLIWLFSLLAVAIGIQTWRC